MTIRSTVAAGMLTIEKADGLEREYTDQLFSSDRVWTHW